MTAARISVRRRRMAGWLALFAVAAALVAQPAPARAEEPTGRYIVSTYTGAGTEATLAKLARTGTRPHRRYSQVMTGFAASLTADQLATLRSDPRVRAVTVDRVLRTSSVQASPTWGLDRVDQRSNDVDHAYSYATTGAGVTIFDVDTGIRLDHQEFGGRARSGYDFVDDDSNATDCNGHGTHVAGTAAGSTYGVAKAANLVAVRVLDCDGEGYESSFITALQYVVSHRPAGPAVVNISAGGPATDTLNEAVAATVRAGIPVVVAAGNEDENACRSSPAGAAAAITVGASTATDRRASFSNYGSCVDIFAPGTDITSAYISSTTATATWDGTSMAAPHVTGAVARYLQAYPSASPADVSRALLGDATSGAVTDLAGSPNKLLYLRSGTTGSPLKAVSKRSDAAHTITESWAPPYGFGATGVTGYRITRSGGADTSGATNASVDVSASTRSYTFTKLKPGAVYSVTVAALNSAGVGSKATSRVSMLAGPGKPRVVKPSSGSTHDSTTSITAKWKAPSSGGAVASYIVAVRRSGSTTVKTLTAKAGDRSRKVTKLTKNASYQVRVEAVNDAGKSAWSAWSAKSKAK